MNKYGINLVLLVLIMGFAACGERPESGEPGESHRFSVVNPLNETVSNAPVTATLSEIHPSLDHCNFQLFQVGGESVDDVGMRELPSQCDDLTGNGEPDELFFLADFDAQQTLDFELRTVAERPEYAPRTQAFLQVMTGGYFEDGEYRNATGMEKVTRQEVPDEHEPGSGWAYMDGPVWESDLVGYRFYLDSRNRIDIFSKSMPDLVLDTITQNYHQIHPWGTDVLVVGPSLGLGSFAALHGEEIKVIDNWSANLYELVVDGPLRSIIRMTYNDWEVFGQVVTVVKEIEIHASHRYTEQRFYIIGDYENMTFATGIARHESVERMHAGNHAESLFGWTTGKQADQGDGLEMGVIVPQIYQPEVQEGDPHTYLISFHAPDGEVAYRYTSAWELDHEPVEDFEAHLRETAAMFTNPPRLLADN